MLDALFKPGKVNAVLLCLTTVLITVGSRTIHDYLTELFRNGRYICRSTKSSRLYICIILECVCFIWVWIETIVVVRCTESERSLKSYN